MKKICGRMLIMLLAVCMLWSLAGCAGEDPAKGKTKIYFWSPPFVEVETTDWLQKWTDHYNETNQNNVYIELEFIAQDAWAQTLKAAQEDGTAPQITFSSYADVLRKSVDGMYTPLDDLISDSAFADLYNNMDELTVANGKRYIYPAFTEPYSILFYRKSLLQEKGLQVPKSWDELYEAAKALTVKNGIYGIALPGSAQLGYASWGFQAMSGNYLLNDNWDTPIVQTDFYRELFAMWGKMYNESLTPKVALGNYNEIKPLAEGKVAMQLCGSWVVGQLKNDYPDVISDVGIAVCPTRDGVVENVTTAAMGGWGLAIDGNAKNPQEAAAFVEYLLGGDEQIMFEFFKSTGYSKMTGRKSVDEFINADDEAKNDEFRKYISKNIAPFAKPEPIYMWEISQDYANALESTYLNGVSIDKALADLHKKINGYIAANELAGNNPQKKA